MKVEIYGASWCNPCQKTKSLCEAKGYEYTFKDVSQDQSARKEVEDRLGRRIDTIPQVFVDGQYIGGADEFRNYVK